MCRKLSCSTIGLKTKHYYNLKLKVVSIQSGWKWVPAQLYIISKNTGLILHHEEKREGKKKYNAWDCPYHRTSEWLRLKETSGNYPFQIPFSKQGQVAHSHFQLWLDYCGWRLQIISEQPVPIFDCSKSKNKQTKTFIMLTFTFLYSSLCPLPLFLWMGITEKSLAYFLSLPVPYTRYLYAANFGHRVYIHNVGLLDCTESVLINVLWIYIRYNH